MTEFKKMLVFSHKGDAIGYATITRYGDKANVRFGFNSPYFDDAVILTDKAYRLRFSGETRKTCEVYARGDVHVILPYQDGYVYASTGKKLDGKQISEALNNEKSQIVIGDEKENIPPHISGVRNEKTQSEGLSLFPLYHDDEIAQVNFYPSSLSFVVDSDARVEAASTAIHDRSLRGAARTTSVRASAVTGRKADFYEGVKVHLDGLFASHDRFEPLERKLPQSKWVKVEYGAGYYLVGVIGDPPDFVAYGVEGVFESQPEEFAGYGKWTQTDDGKGFWLVFQSATTGETLKDGI
jgi:hypothetical protein